MLKKKDITWLVSLHNRPGLKSVFAIDRMVAERGRARHEICYYITHDIAIEAIADHVIEVSRNERA